MDKKMSRWGIGIKLIIFSVPYAIIAEALTILFPEFFEIKILPYNYLVAIGTLLLLAGILLLIKSAYKFTIAFNHGELITTGLYALVRNPIYSEWIFFITPGVAILLKSWLVLATSIVTYLCFKYFIIEEEKYLEKKFGNAYLEYKNQVNQIFPFPHKIKNNKK